MPETGKPSAPGMPGSVVAGAAEHPAVAFLATAYPDKRERTRALGWLAWIAWHMRTDRYLAWWDIPAWVGERKIRFARILAGSVTLGLSCGLATALVHPADSLWAGASAAFLGWLVGRSKWMKPGRLWRERLPYAMVPGWPQSWRDGVSLAVRLGTGLFLRRKLIRMWARPVTAAPPVTGDGRDRDGRDRDSGCRDSGYRDSGYRACRRSTAIDGLACVMSGLPAALLAFWLGPPMLIVGGIVVGLCYLAALADGKLPPVKLAEAVLLVQRRHTVTFHRLLESGVRRQVLRRAGAYYQFRDTSLQEYLAGVYQAGVDARARRIPEAVAAAEPGVRTRLLALLSRDTIVRLAVDAGGGVGVTTAALIAEGQVAARVGWDSWFAVVLEWLAIAVLIPVMTAAALYGLVRFTGWSLWVTSMMPRWARIAAPAGAAGAAGLSVWLAGPSAVRHEIAAAAIELLAAALVAGVGSWAAALTHLRWRQARLRWLRLAGDLLLAVAAASSTLLVADRNLLSAQAAVGLLFPVVAWLSVLTWRAMNGSKRLWVRAGADVAVSLMLGSTLLLLLVWLANLLQMPAAEVAVLRAALHRADRLIDLPWQLWAAASALLAASSLAFARWPTALGEAARWFARLHIAPTANAARRGLSGMHIGLLVVALIGLAAPSVVGPALRTRLAARYAGTLLDNLRAEGELSAYREIQRTAELGFTPAELAVLATMVVQIDDISRPAAGQPGATATELDLARRLGMLQEETLGLAPSPPLGQAEAAAARQAGFDAPIANAADLSKRIGGLDHEQRDEGQVTELVDQTAEEAATALAAALHIPRIGNLEVIQVITEYLGGLLENSPLTDFLAQWAGRLAGAHPPPTADTMVVPDPAKLKAAAAAEVTRELTEAPVSDPAAARRLFRESAVVAAVDLVNQARYLQEDTGPCADCARPEPSGGEPGPGPDNPEPVIIDG